MNVSTSWRTKSPHHRLPRRLTSSAAKRRLDLITASLHEILGEPHVFVGQRHLMWTLLCSDRLGNHRYQTRQTQRCYWRRSHQQRHQWAHHRRSHGHTHGGHSSRSSHCHAASTRHTYRQSHSPPLLPDGVILVRHPRGSRGMNVVASPRWSNVRTINGGSSLITEIWGCQPSTGTGDPGEGHRHGHTERMVCTALETGLNQTTTTANTHATGHPPHYAYDQNDHRSFPNVPNAKIRPEGRKAKPPASVPIIRQVIQTTF